MRAAPRRGYPARLFALGVLLGCRDAPPGTVGEALGDHAFLTPIDAPATVAAAGEGGAAFPTAPEACGACHADHLAEWAPSSHAHAVRDAQFLAELAKPEQPRWLCLNCHAPTALQRAERITPETRLAEAGNPATLAAAPNPEFDPARLADGIGCAACHVRRDADGAGVVIGPRGSGRAPHRVRVDAAALHDVCERCHAPVPEAEAYRVSPSLPCWFTTAEELATGPDAARDCVDCHMPPVERAAAAGGPSLTLRRHGWAGSGVPKDAAGYASLAARGWSFGAEVEVSAAPPSVRLVNRAGHALPTADPERFLRVEARYEDAAGTVLARDLERIGQTWDFGDGTADRPARRLADDRLQAGETRTWLPALPAPPPAAVALVVEVLHVRVTAANAATLDAAAPDAELAAAWPDWPRDLRAAYPLASVVFRARVELSDGTVTRAAAHEIAADSIALMGLAAEAQAARVRTP